MASAVYLAGRQQYTRPQAVLWTDSYSIEGGLYVPNGVEYTDFIILSDHGRNEIEVKPQRIENRKRMINGRMRSYHVADKESYSWAWDMLPSRAFNKDPQFDANGVPQASDLVRYTVDGGAGGSSVVDWYDSHKGSFYMLLSYDHPETAYANSAAYVRAVEVYWSDFSYNVVKRGVSDFWDISVGLEEA